MIYGVGWIIATDTSTERFLVITAALVITLGLGYVRFVRQARPTAGTTAAPAHADALEARVQRLEQRLDDAARALVRPGAPPEP
jgi:hypothetical protein